MNLTLATFLPLLPVIVLSITTVAVMLAVAIKRHHGASYWITIIGLLASLVFIDYLDVFAPGKTAVAVTGLLFFDSFTYFYSVLIIFAALVCTPLLRNYLNSYTSNIEEVYMLLLISVIGGLVLVSSNHMASFFIGLELLSVPVYGMVAYTYERNRSLEAGIKYLVLSAAASAFMLFGMALIYAQLGTLSFVELGEKLPGSSVYLAGFGAAMITIALGFKLSLAPFHLWTPDVYQGAPAPVGALLATVGKVAVIAILIRFLLHLPPELTLFFQPIFAALAIISIFVGNFLALTQNSVKRMLAYSSIAHMGYMMIPLVSGGSVAVGSINIYLLAYVVTSLGAFGVISVLSAAGQSNDADDISHYRGLFWRNRYLALAMTFILLSLAGIPMTTGFIGKFYIFLTGVNNQSWVLLAALIIGSGLGLYYYLRVMIALYKQDDTSVVLASTSRSGVVLVVVLAILVLWLGLYPQPALEFLGNLHP